MITQNTVWVLLCIALASYVQNLTGFVFGLIFLALVGVYDLIPIEVAAIAVTLITLSQTFIGFVAIALRDGNFAQCVQKIRRPSYRTDLLRTWAVHRGSATVTCPL